MANHIDTLRDRIGFKLIPLDPGNDGVAFAGFLNWATRDSVMAEQLQADFFVASGRAPGIRKIADMAETADFVDYLIRAHWGEEGASAPVEH